MSPAPRLLIIGVGNPLRGDDGAGERVLDLLETRALPRAQLLRVHSLLPEHAVDIAANAAEHDAVVFVDADVSTGSVVLEPLADNERAGLHGYSPAVITTYARALGFVGEAWVCRLPAPVLGAGPGLSEMAEEGARRAAALLVAWAAPR